MNLGAVGKTIVGVGGFVATITLGEWNHIAGIVSGASVTIFMLTQTVLVIRRKEAKPIRIKWPRRK